MCIFWALEGIIMKNLNAIFNLLLFPFLFLMRFSLFRKNNRSKIKKIIVSLFLLFIFVPSSIHAVTINIDVAHDDDDAEEQSDGDMDRGSSDLEMVYDEDDQVIGIRFLLSIPEDAVILNAYIRFQADGDRDDSTSLKIYAQNSDSTARFSSTDYDISNRSKTIGIPWNDIEDWDDDKYYNTPNLKSIIQTVINRPSWDRSSLTFIIDGSGERRAESKDGSHDEPRLYIEYEIISTPIPPIINPIPPQSATKDDPYLLDLKTFVTLTNGDPIITNGYVLTGSLPVGLSFKSDTGVLNGVPTETGNFILSLTAEDNDDVSNSESFTLTVSEAPVSCINYDSDNNDCSSVKVITSMDQIEDSKRRCIYGESRDGSSDSADYYKFTVKAFGTLDVTGTTLNDNDYHLSAGSVCGNEDYYPDTTAKNHTIPTINLVPGDTVYFYAKETGGDTDEYEIDFNFIADNSFKARDDNYHTAVNQPKALDVLANDSAGENETIQTNSITITNAPADGVATVNTNGTITYIPGTNYEGTDTFKYTVRNSAGDISNEATVYISIGITIISRGAKAFELRNPPHTRNIRGNMEVIGNTLQCVTTSGSSFDAQCDNNRNAHNNGRYTNYLDIDSNSDTFNSTSATLSLPADSKVIWAGLYWQSYLHNSTSGKDYAFDTQISGEPHLGSSPNNLILDEGNSWDVENVLWKRPTDSSYHGVKAERVDFDYLGYSGFIDVTHLIDLNDPNGKYTIANVKGNRGEEGNHGNFGGWNIIFIYTHPDEEVRNVSVYNGYYTVNSSSPINITIDGFRTPSEGDIDTKLSFFSMEGEYGSGGDYLEVNGQRIIDQENSDTDIFDGSITGSPLRDPKLDNNDGLDLDTFDVSHTMTHDQRSATILSATGGDRYTPSMFAFNTQLYVPDVCYDYVVRKNDYTIDADDRKITTTGNGELSVGVSIRSMEGDIDLETAQLKLRLTPSDKATFTRALYSPTTVNTLIEGIHTSASSPTNPEIGIGSNVGSEPTIGGTIGALERYFTKFYYDLDQGSFDGGFEFDLNTSIDFGSGPVDYVLSSENGTINRCEQSNVYNPQWGMFNIERIDSSAYNTLTQGNQRFPLYTQIVGRDFDLSVVAYDADASVPFSEELSIADVTVEVELVDVTSFDDNGSFFKCDNTDPSIIQTLSGNQKSFFVSFPSTANSRVDISESDDMVTDTALKNAAFRMWILMDENNTIVPHLCAKNDNQCFIDNVYDHIDTGGTPCDASNCSSYISTERADSGCYACLRDYFAKPICSRDNFSIRPESYRLRINDHNESTDINDPKVNLSMNHIADNRAILAAEYSYILEGNATIFDSSMAAKNYYSDLNTTLYFDPNTGTCNDTQNYDFLFTFENGRIRTLSEVTHANVGNYELNVTDTTWTKVDQRTFSDKTFDSDDCVLYDGSTSSTGRDQSGCNTVSNLYELDNTKDHHNLYLTFQPYSFDLSGINSILPNAQNFIYTNNINTTNILQLHMSVAFEGNITAIGKQGTRLSNYTNGCTAEPVLFDINRTVVRGANEINENSIKSIDVYGSSVIDEKISLQRQYVNISGASNYTTENNQIASTTAITIVKNQFKDDKNGSAAIELYYNLERKDSKVMDPVSIDFLTKEANSTDASSSAHLKTDYIPTGNANITLDPIHFYYGRVVAGQEAPYVIPKSEQQTIISMYVEAYCNSFTLDCSLHNLTQASLRDNNWWINTQHISSASMGDGNILELKDVQPSSPLTITPDTDIFLNPKGDITVRISPSVLRPYNTTIDVRTDAWLGYNPDGIYDPIVHFLGGGGWAGKGKTGVVVETDPHFDENNKRIEW